MVGERSHERKILRARAEADSQAKDVAGKAIGKHGLLYITVIVIVGVGASFFLGEEKIAAVIGLVSAALTALIAMLSGVAEAERDSGPAPELEIVRRLIEKMDNDHMIVDVRGDRVTVEKGRNVINAHLSRSDTGMAEHAE
jgi:hypothetical protein